MTAQSQTATPAQAGMLMIPMALGAMTSKLFVNQLVEHFGYQRVLVVNTVLVGALIAAYALLGPTTPLWRMCCQLFVMGVFNSIQFAAMNTVTLKDLTDETASSGNSLLSVMMQLATSLGVAMAAALLAIFTEGRIRQDTVLAAFHATFISVGCRRALPPRLCGIRSVPPARRVTLPARSTSVASSSERGET